MDDEQKTLLLLALIIAIMLYASRAHAQIAPPTVPVHTAPARLASVAPGGDQLAAMHEIRTAERRLERAALQRDFSSDAKELALLQSAHDRVAPAIQRLCCAQRVRAAYLESDIDFAIARAIARLEPLLSTTGASSGPPAPSRDQLAQLAVEAQDLVRNARLMHRLIDTGNGDLRSQKTSDLRSRAVRDPIDYANPDTLSWPPTKPDSVPQLRFRF